MMENFGGLLNQKKSTSNLYFKFIIRKTTPTPQPTPVPTADTYNN